MSRARRIITADRLRGKAGILYHKGSHSAGYPADQMFAQIQRQVASATADGPVGKPGCKLASPVGQTTFTVDPDESNDAN